MTYTEFNKIMSDTDLATLGGGEIAYVKEAKLTSCTRQTLETDTLAKYGDLGQIRCVNHSQNKLKREYHEVNALSFYYEDDVRCNFSRVAFYDPLLNMSDDCRIEENVCESHYFLDSMKHCKEIDRKIFRQQGKFAEGHTAEYNLRQELQNIEADAEESLSADEDDGAAVMVGDTVVVGYDVGSSLGSGQGKLQDFEHIAAISLPSSA